jgi:cellulose 1,4-beta-cellobiosidase
LALAGHAAAAGNPFKGKTLYINPVNAKQYDSSIKTAKGKTKDNLERMKTVPSAYWIDVKAKIRGNGTKSLEGIIKDAIARPQREMAVFIFYDLPNRDCKAKASNGEICCTKKPDGRCDYHAGGDCAEGLREYKEEYVDPFTSILQKYEGKLDMAVVVEPDSLPNLATNLDHPGCGSTATQTAYKKGIKYALDQLTSKAPSVAVYLDAAHGAWLGWENSMTKFMEILRSMDLPKIRGFATNVANYQPLGVQCPWCPDEPYRNTFCLNGKHKSDPCCEDPCGLLGQWNPANNEHNYAAGLVAAANHMLGWDAHVIIDTGRNGVADHRQKCSSWCNPRNSGAGVPSTTETANPSLVDAYLWLKTPGESDGCSEILPNGDKCPRYDADCGKPDSLSYEPSEPRSPEAGHWYDYQVKQLAKFAVFEQPPRRSGGKSCDRGGGNHGGGGHGGGNHGGGTHPPIQPPTQPPTHGGGGNHGGGGGSCSPIFGQCGGSNWKGPTCCEPGCRCRREGPDSEHYQQCESVRTGYWTCEGPPRRLSANASRILI